MSGEEKETRAIGVVGRVLESKAEQVGGSIGKEILKKMPTDDAIRGLIKSKLGLARFGRE